MSRRHLVALIVVSASLGGQAAAGAVLQGPPFAFGGTGPHGPYTVTISTDGSVHGAGGGGLVRIGAAQLTSARLAALHRIATVVRFSTLPALTRCAGAPSAVESTWVRVGARRVAVDGSCLPRYQRMLKALVAAAHFSNG